jgi:hypothetical protein
MNSDVKKTLADQAEAHSKAILSDVAYLRAMSPRERSILIESACESAATIYRSRHDANIVTAKPDPWPPSTWEFLRKHAARVQS